MVNVLETTWEKIIGLLCHSFGPGEFILLGVGKGYAGALTRLSTRHLLTQNQQKNAAENRRCIFTVKIGALHNYGNYCTLYALIKMKYSNLGTLPNSCLHIEYNHRQ